MGLLRAVGVVVAGLLALAGGLLAGVVGLLTGVGRLLRRLL
jgi:hypothetical protein